MTKKKRNTITNIPHEHTWLWVSLLGFARGLVVAALMSVAMVMLKRLGMGNSWASCGTALLALPFVLRQLLKPLMLALPHREWWMVGMQGLFAISMWGVAMDVEPNGGGAIIWWWLALAALTGAMHGILAGDFTNALRGNRRPGRTSVAITLPILATVLALGVTLVIAGDMEVLSRDIDESWGLAFKVMAAMVLAVAVAMALSISRYKTSERRVALATAWHRQMKEISRWWHNSRHWMFAAFIVLFSLHECFVLKGVLLFLVDPGSIGGLSLGPQEVAFAHSTVAGLAMIAGCVLGFEAIQKNGLRKWVLPMVLAITVPDVLLLYLAYAMPSEISMVCLCLSIESFGCGFGMAGFVRFLRYYGPGRSMAAYGDTCLALVALAMLLAGVVTGFIQDYFGYRRFFLFVIIMAIVAIASLWLLRNKRI